LRESDKGREPRQDDNIAVKALLWLLNLALSRWMYLVGAPVLAIGGAFLAAAWQMGPAYHLQKHEVTSMSGRAEARSIEPFWWLDLDTASLDEAHHWSRHARMKLCITAAYSVAEQGYRRVFCGRGYETRAPGRYGVLDVGEILPGVRADWPRDSAGHPVIELRMSPEANAFLTSREAEYWMLVGQTEEVRAVMPPRGTELDYLFLEIDRPLEWLVRLWPREHDASVPLRHDATHPEEAYPEIFVAGLGLPSDHLVAAIVSLLIGLAAWRLGILYLLFEQSPRTRLIVGVLPLVFLPWWSDTLAGAARWIDRDNYRFGAEFVSELTMGRDMPISTHDPDELNGLDRILWPIAGSPSHYATLLEPIRLRRPQVPPENADDALLEAVRQVDAYVDGLSDAECKTLFEGLSWAEKTDRGEVSLLFLSSARKIALDPDRSSPSRQAAERFVMWVTSLPIEPTPGEPAFAVRVALWRALTDFPTVPGVEVSARQVLARIGEG
jgi:hypothetical protein